MKHTWIIATLLAAHAVAALAQTVYESKDKAGPVFSDRPSPGAVPMELPPPNVVSAPTAAPRPADAAASAAAPGYRRLVVTRPAEQDMVHSNNGEFGIAASLSPPLRRNDRVRVLLDGNLVPTVFRSTHPQLSAADWQAAAIGSNEEHTLQLVVVDADGKPRIESAPVRFYLRGVAVGGRRR